jgi:hypothetical protein
VFNLILAAIWLAGAVVVFVLQALQGEDAPLFVNLFGQRFSVAWFMLVLTLYNLAHWWARRAALAERRALRAAWEREQLHNARRAPAEGGKEPDPNFRFTDEPPAPSVPDQPPAPN